MSALTKIGIILLVVASLLLSAGVVVFVNKVEDYNKAAIAAENKWKTEAALRTGDQAQISALKAAYDVLVQQGNSRADKLRQDISNLEKTMGDLNTKIVAAEAGRKDAETNSQVIAAALKASQDQNTAYQGQIAELRKIRDQLVEERHQLNVQLTDALSKLEATERQWRNAQESAAGLRAQLNGLEAKVKAAGFADTSLLPSRSTAGTSPIEGVVSAVFDAGGKPWASISVGAKDNVTKDMKFNVVNNNEFLGYLIIKTTEPNEAAGVLEGPKVDKVKSGDIVKTQLQ